LIALIVARYLIALVGAVLGGGFMNWLSWQRVRRAVLLASTALDGKAENVRLIVPEGKLQFAPPVSSLRKNKANKKNRSSLALARHSALRPKVVFEAMEPRVLLSADPVITLAAASVVEISQHDTLAADGGASWDTITGVIL
jgi:hypothetical protein